MNTCYRQDFLECSHKIEDSRETCGCLLIDYLPIVDRCDIGIRVVSHITSDKDNENKHYEHLCIFLKFWKRLKELLTLRLDTSNLQKKMMIDATLELMIQVATHKITTFIALFITPSILIVFFNVFLLGAFALIALLLYIPVMQINNDLENYNIIDVLHQRKVIQEKDGTINATSAVIVTGVNKYITMQSILQNKYTVISQEEYNAYEFDYIKHISQSVPIVAGVIKNKIILVKKGHCKYKVYK